jgi:hypothetical protein
MESFGRGSVFPEAEFFLALVLASMIFNFGKSQITHFGKIKPKLLQ